ncbi:retention module-containing protein [Halomonas sp. H5]|uniref:retention module-containing protein n=1 Tax=Halomonas sp. H5 TaxID=3423910 RepID=UPI003D35A294
MSIAVVLSVTGQAWARDAEGNLRELRPGDVLQEGEVVVTSDDGSVDLDFGGGEAGLVVIEPGQEVLMQAELAPDAEVDAEQASVQDDEVEALLAALEDDDIDLLDILEDTAAGAGAGGDGAGGGHGFIRLARITEGVDPLNYQYGVGLAGGPEDGLGEPQLLEDESLPTISVVDAEGGNQVDEAALDDGSNPGSPAESISGGFNITHSGDDTTASLVVGGVDVTNGGVVNGSYGTLTVTLNGGVYEWTYTLDDNTTDHPDDTSTGTSEGIQDVFSVTVTDSDGDTASTTLTIDVLDDGPSVTGELSEATVVLDETDAGEAFVAGPISATSAAAILDVSALFGADGAAASDSLVYGLALSGDGSTGLTTTVGGHAISLEQTSDTLISGVYDGANVAFTVEIHADGTLTVTQHVALAHPDTGDPDDTLNLAGLITATVEITDGDGDSAEASAEIGGAVTFHDDGPSVTGELSEATVVLDETDAGEAFEAGPISATSAAAILDVNALFGADGAAASDSLVYGLALSGDGSTGLTTTVGGHAITLVAVSDTEIQGQFDGTNVAFTVEIHADGTLTVTQHVALAHPDTGDPDDTLNLAGLITATVEITDGDGDSAEASAEIGGAVTFHDDGPSVTGELSEATVVLDETDAGEAFEDGPISATSAAAILDVNALFGADGAAASDSLVYGLALSGDGSTGLTTTVGGHAITLVAVSDTEIQGQFDGTNVAFTVEIHADGTLTVTQHVALAHPDTGDPDDTLNLAGLITATVEITDGDGDSAEASAEIGGAVTFHDDGPSVTGELSEATVVLDETDAGEAFVAGPISATSAAAILDVSALFGADGAAASDSLVYGLALSGDGSTGLTTTVGGHAISLEQTSDTLISGVYDGANVAFTVEIHADGTLTVTQHVALAHPDTGDPDDTLNLAGLITATVEITDGDGDSAEASAEIGGAVTFHDDGPSVTGELSEATVVLDETDAGEAFVAGPISATSAAAILDVSALFGADGAAASDSLVYGLALSGDGSTGLTTTVGGHAISLEQTSDTLISGVYDGANVAFTVEIHADGTLTVTQHVALAHPDTGDPDDTLNLAGLITATVEITDGDGDSAEASAEIGGAVTFHDDGPSVTGELSEATVVLDETDAGEAFEDGPISATSAAAILDVNALFGADGAAASDSLVYGLALSGDGSTGLTTTVGGHAITLVAVSDTEIQGQFDGTNVAFTVEIHADGTLTVTQHVALAHPDTGDPDDTLNLAGLITATVEITDGDGDSAEASAEIGGAVTFHDDGPSVTGELSEATVVLDETDAGEAFVAGPISATSAAAILDVSALFGADGAAASDSLVYGLALSGDGSTGLTTTVGGHAISLEQTSDTLISGVYDGGQVAFTVEIHADGTLTVTQHVALAHPDTGDPDDTLNLAGLITATVEITDGDGDSAEASAEIGGAVTFHDDGPSVTGELSEATVVLDETDAGEAFEAGPISATSAAAILDVNALFGADGAAASDSLVYGLALSGDGSTGLTTTVGGHAITLVAVSDTEIQGQFDGTNVAFTVEIHADGTLTVTQHVALAHPDTGDPDDTLNLAGLITATVEITDGDGDSAEASAEIGGAVTFHDDGPSVTGELSEATVVLDETDAGEAFEDGPISATSAAAILDVNALFGADGAAASDSLVYGLALSGDGSTGLTTTVGGHAITLVAVSDTEIQGQFDGTNVAFTVEIHADGTLTVTQHVALAHPDTGDPDDTLNLAGLITATVEITDGDGDSAEASAEIGGAVTFHDDGPSVTGELSEATVVLDETDAGEAFVAGPISATSAAAILDVSALFGADGAAASDSLVYGLALSGDGSTGLTTTVGGHAISLEQTSDTLISGVYDGGQVAFTVEIHADGTLTVTQHVALAHPDTGDPDDTLNLAGLITATVEITDGDGDSAEASAEIGGAVTFHDDGPSVFTPMSTIIANNTTAASIAALDVFGNTGADGLGGAVFIGTDDAQLFESDGVTAVTSGGEDLFMTGFGTNVLTISTAGGTPVMTIVLNPDADLESQDLYTVQIHQELDDGSGVVFDDFSAAPAGNNQWIGLDGDGGDIMADTNDSEDLLITAPGGQVNTSATDLGVDNQWTDDGESLRIDFVTDLRRDGGNDEKDAEGYTYDDHYMVNNFSMNIVQVQGGGTVVVGFRIFDFDDAGDKKDLAAGSTQLSILLASVVVTDGAIILTEGEDYTVSTDGNWVFVNGLEEGQTVGFTGASNFEAVEIINADGMSDPDGGTFSGSAFGAGGFGFSSPVAGEDIPMEFDIELADGDGDTVQSTIDVTVTPDGDILQADDSGQALAGGGGNDTLIGGEGNDLLVGGGGDDTMTGGLGADTFVWNLNDEGTNVDPAEDKVTDFTLGDFGSDADADQLDISDLLQGANVGNIDGYVFAEESGSDTILHIKHDGGISGDGSNADQMILLSDVSMGDDNSAAFIQSLIDDGQLSIE